MQAGLLFFTSVFWSFFPPFMAIFTFRQERAILGKERWAEMYKLSAYFAARNTSDLPLDLLLPTVFMLIGGTQIELSHIFTYFAYSLPQHCCCPVYAALCTFDCKWIQPARFMDVKKASL
ncbi:ABC transporter G family member 27-like protein [Drosera capensis]